MSDAPDQFDSLRATLAELLLGDSAVVALAPIPGDTLLDKATNVVDPTSKELPILSYTPEKGLAIQTGILVTNATPVPHTLDRLSKALQAKATELAGEAGLRLPHLPRVSLVTVSVLPEGTTIPGC